MLIRGWSRASNLGWVKIEVLSLRGGGYTVNMERCLGRTISNFKRGLFQGGVNTSDKTKRAGYYLEFRCEKMVSSGKLCEKCIERRIIEDDDTKSKAGNQSILWQGLVTEAITSKYIFGGTEWLKDAAAYGLSQEGLETGIAAHNDAVKGLNGVPPLPDMSAMVKKEVTDPPPKKTRPKKDAVAVAVPVPVPVVKPSKIRIVKPREQSNVLEAISQPAAEAEAPLVVPPPQPEVKPKRVYKKKVASAASAPPPPPIALLSEEKPVDVDDVETIEVTVKHINGTDYYYDSRSHKNKLYNPKTGKYVGRWDSAKDGGVIRHDIPDSDAE